MESAFRVYAGISFAVQRIGTAGASREGPQNRVGHQLDSVNIQMKERALVRTDQDVTQFIDSRLCSGTWFVFRNKQSYVAGLIHPGVVLKKL